MRIKEMQQVEKYLNKSLSIRERVNDLLDRMTVEEKVDQLRQDIYGWKCYRREGETVSFTEYLDNYLESTHGVGCLYGVFRADPWSGITDDTGIPAEQSLEVAHKLQKKIMAANRFHIPALFVEEAPHGHQALGSVSYPINIGKGNSFDTSLFEEMARQTRKGMAQKGVHLALISTLDLARDPRWGRTEECLSEDGVVSAKYTEAIIKGFQDELINDVDDFLSQPVPNLKTAQVGVVLKHLIGQGDALGGHNSGSSLIGPRELLDIYGPLIHASRNAAGVMAAYNDIDGVPCHGNPWLINDLLRKKNGFKGIVMSDAIALDRLATHYTNPGLAANQALTAGVDENMWDELYPHLGEYVADGLVSESLINRAAFRVLSLKFLLGIFDDPFKEPEPFDKSKADAVNLNLASESITMVKNNGILPLRQTQKKIAVIGPNGNSIYNLLGDYTAPQSLQNYQTIFEALRDAFPLSDVRYAKGCEIRDDVNQPQLINEAIDLAKNSDLIVLAIGGSSTRNFGMKFHKNGAVSSKGINMDSGENVDLSSLELGGLQEELISDLAMLGKPIVTIVIEGRPHNIESVLENSDAVLIGWYPGQQGGPAIANILRGITAPTGRLNISYPRSVGQLPVFYNQRENTAPDYYNQEQSALFPFGYGLGYRDLKIEAIDCSVNQITTEKLNDGECVVVNVKIVNPNNIATSSTFILTTKGLINGILSRRANVADFTRVDLEAGEQREIQFVLDAEHLSQTDYDFKSCLYMGVVTVDVNNSRTQFSII